MASLVWQFFVGPLIGFLLGGFPTAYVICKLVKGIDPREFGSGSVSTRNVIRATGGFFPWGLVNGFTDMMKGAAACAIVEFAICPSHPNLEYIVVLTALAAVAGHCWMPYLGFKGGKGLGTMAGTLLFFYWPMSPLIFPILIGLLSLLSGYSGVGSVWGVSFISPFFFIIDLIGPSMQIVQPIPHPFLTDGTYGIAFTIVYGFGIILVILLRYLPEFKKIRSGEAKRWTKLTSSDVMK
ncbi:MAG: glycerol-3-phosphate acyltransferase [Candidatus Heimdallarchaeota archaeon]|nr:glycerol-3-phosphate acyltransferase [Candidatus Heimdallarchaeota archaeon]